MFSLNLIAIINLFLPFPTMILLLVHTNLRPKSWASANKKFHRSLWIDLSQNFKSKISANGNQL